MSWDQRGMNESACIEDLFQYEAERAAHIKANSGELEGFVPKHGHVLSAVLQSNDNLQAHLAIPQWLEDITLDSECRRLLIKALKCGEAEPRLVTEGDVAQAKAFVAALFDVDLGKVEVILAPKRVMGAKSTGVTYAAQAEEHIVVVPGGMADPVGTLVFQLAVASHYTAMRTKGTIGSMISDSLTQAMVGRFATTRWAREHQPDALALQLREIAQWEFAIGLGKTPTYPMGFMVSDLGVSLIRDYGDDYFKSVVTELYDSMSDGRAMWWGTNNFYGSVLAIEHLEDTAGMRRFIFLDAGDRSLEAKLSEAMTEHQALKPKTVNQKLSSVLEMGLSECAEA